MSLSISQTSTESITNIVFGIFAVVIGAVTIWQGYRAWNIWRCHHRVQQPNALDVELAFRSHLPVEPISGSRTPSSINGASLLMPAAPIPADISTSPAVLASIEPDRLSRQSFQDVQSPLTPAFGETAQRTPNTIDSGQPSTSEVGEAETTMNGDKAL